MLTYEQAERGIWVWTRDHECSNVWTINDDPPAAIVLGRPTRVFLSRRQVAKVRYCEKYGYSYEITTTGRVRQYS